MLTKEDVTYIDDFQCFAGADGVSRQLKSIHLYHSEFSRISELHDVKVKLNLWFHLRKIRILWPLTSFIFDFKKKISWNKL